VTAGKTALFTNQIILNTMKHFDTLLIIFSSLYVIGWLFVWSLIRRFYKKNKSYTQVEEEYDMPGDHDLVD